MGQRKHVATMSLTRDDHALTMGWLADTCAMRIGFAMPLICFVSITFYAAFRPTLERLATGHVVVD
jgi:uncharacterized membrane protein